MRKRNCRKYCRVKVYHCLSIKPTKFVVNHMRQNGVLISATGPGANVLKIRPPLVLQQPEAALFLDVAEAAFAAARAAGI